MLITFKVSNFLSFNEQIEFSMRAGQVRELRHHLVEGKGRNDIDILKSAVIYGANASGKSNFIKALEFFKILLKKGLPQTSTENKYFRLDTNNANLPTQFELEFKHNNKMYAYGVVLSLKDRTIKEEWLFELLKTTDKPVFERLVLENGKSEISIGIKLDSDGKKRFDVYKKDVKDSQFFLSMINDKNIEEITNIQPFKDTFEWIQDSIVIIYPDTKTTGLDYIGDNEEMKKAYYHFLQLFNTGVKDIETVEQEIDETFPKKIQEEILNRLTEKQPKRLVIRNGNSRNTFTFFKNENNELKVLKLNTRRNLKNSNEFISFEISDESDGTQRIMDFIPALVSLTKSDKTYLIDEIDRSLHPELTQKLLEVFFNNTQNIESQLIVTTHESSLLDLNLLRRDEIWFVEKDLDGASNMYSLEQFKPRHDKEVRKSYLQGRFGAIPFVSNVENLGWLKELAK